MIGLVSAVGNSQAGAHKLATLEYGSRSVPPTAKSHWKCGFFDTKPDCTVM